jgi:MFS family permease
VRETLELLKQERRARTFFGVLTQSALGTGAGYVALLLIAFDRFESPWAISAVLIADMVPAMLLGPVFGAAADRWSRRACAVVADVARAAAFAGIALVDGFEATVALALLAGAGTGLFNPAALASLPSLVVPRRLPAATALYGAITDLGFTLGPAIGAAVLLAGGPESILVANAATFGLSAVVLVGLQFGEAPVRQSELEPPPLLREAREGLLEASRIPGLAVVLGASSAALFFGGIFNVGELLFATDALGTTESGFSVLVTVFGVGFVAGSLTGSRGGAPGVLKRRYLAGLMFMALGLLGSAGAPVFAVALGTFAVQGFGNGLVLVYERMLIQTSVPDRLAGRVFGAKDALASWAFTVAFVCAGGLISAIGVRTSFLVAGLGGVALWLGSVLALRGAWADAGEAAPDVGEPRRPGDLDVGSASLSTGAPRGASVEPSGRHPSTRSVRYGRAGSLRLGAAGDRERWLALLDDLADGGDDAGIELGRRLGR